MTHRVWLLETSDGAYEAFLNVEDARDFAYKKIIEWGYDPTSDHDKEIFDELEESYKNEKYAGFWVEELLWCYEINYHC